MKAGYLHGIVLQSALLAAALFCTGSLMAQNETAKQTIPPFRILLTSNTYLKAADLDKNAATMMVYFDPTCDHCKVFTADLLKHEKDFGNTRIIMITYTPIDQVKKFENDFQISKYKNIKTGTEGTSFIVRHYYNIQRFPFTTLYDKKGNLIATYRDVPLIQELLLALSKV